MAISQHLLFLLLTHLSCSMILQDLVSGSGGGRRGLDIHTLAKTFYEMPRKTVSKRTERDTSMLAQCMAERILTRGRPFQYLSRLQAALEAESAVLARGDDETHRYWSVNAYKAATNTSKYVSFRKCVHCESSRVSEKCKVTRMEVVVSIQDSCPNRSAINDIRLYLHQTKEFLRPVQSTVAMPKHKVVSFRPDIRPSSGVGVRSQDILVRAPSCIKLNPEKVVLLEYCNIETSVLKRLWIHSREGTEGRTSDICEPLLKSKITPKRKIFFGKPAKKMNQNRDEILAEDLTGVRCIDYPTPSSQLDGNHKDVAPKKMENPKINYTHKHFECQLMPLHINLNHDVQFRNGDIKFRNRCVNVGVCMGTCANHLLFNNLKHTKESGSGYAVLFNRIRNGNMLSSEKVKPPSGCRPNRMRSLPVLDLNDSDDILARVRMVRDLIVESCYCG